MLKKLFRAYIRPEAAGSGFFYGFALKSNLGEFLEANPDARPCGCIEVTAQQLSEWKITGHWEDDWHGEDYIVSGTLLRWRLDEPDPTANAARVWDAAHMTVRDICREAHLTQKAASTMFCIPYRTFQGWCLGERECPTYVRLMMARLLNLL